MKMVTETRKPRAVILLATYNEKDNLGKLIPFLFEKVFPQIKDWQLKVLVIDDYSPDGTANVVKKMMKKYPDLELIQGKKEGLGKAYYRGMSYLLDKDPQVDVFIQMDADLSHDPKLIPLLLEKVKEGDVVIGNRYIKGGSIPDKWGLKRKFLSFLGNFIVSLFLFNWWVRDWTTGYRAIKSKVFKAIRNEMKEKRFNGYTWQIAFLNKALQRGYKVVSVPLVFTDRRFGKSKLGPEYIVNTLLYLVSDVIKNPPRFYRFALVGFLGFLVNFFGLAFFSAVFKNSWPQLSVGWRNFLANSVAAELSIISNFIFNNLWTFADRQLSHWRHILVQFITFNLTSFTTGILVPSLIIGCGTALLGDEYRQLILVLAIILFTVPANYFIYNKFIWRKKKSSAK